MMIAQIINFYLSRLSILTNKYESKINLKVFKDFVQSSNFGGTLLFVCVILSLIIANTSLSEPLQNLLNTTIGFENESLNLNYSISLWINGYILLIGWIRN